MILITILNVLNNFILCSDSDEENQNILRSIDFLLSDSNFPGSLKNTTPDDPSSTIQNQNKKYLSEKQDETKLFTFDDYIDFEIQKILQREKKEKDDLTNISIEAEILSDYKLVDLKVGDNDFFVQESNENDNNQISNNMQNLIDDELLYLTLNEFLEQEVGTNKKFNSNLKIDKSYSTQFTDEKLTANILTEPQQSYDNSADESIRVEEIRKILIDSCEPFTNVSKKRKYSEIQQFSSKKQKRNNESETSSSLEISFDKIIPIPPIQYKFSPISDADSPIYDADSPKPKYSPISDADSPKSNNFEKL